MQPKNVVLIMADQMRKDSMGCYGNACAHTPNLDWLAGQSVRFERSYVANPICMPNRLSLFSGMTPSHHGLWTNGLCEGDPCKTLPETLRQNGYQTASIGKIHFSPYSVESVGRSVESAAAWNGVPDADCLDKPYYGFDYTELTIGHTLPKAHYYRWFLRNGGTDDMFGVEPYGPDYSPDERCGVRRMPTALSSSAFVGERAAHYLRAVRSPEKPFFLSVSFPDPHHPFTSCPEDYARFEHAPIASPIGSAEDLQSRPPHYLRHFHGGWTRKGEIPFQHVGGVARDVAEQRIRHTYAMTEALDRNVGRVLDALRDEGLMENTIVLFLSDHGELLGDHGLWMKGPFFYQGLINTPLLIRCPGISPRRSERLVSAVDIAPTLYELTGVPCPAYVDGVSQAQTLKDEGCVSRESCLIEYRNGYGNADVNVNALVREHDQYVQYENGDREYTDLLGDPMERQNLAGQPDMARKTEQAARALLDACLHNKCKGSIQYGHA